MRSARHSGVQLMCTLPASISRMARTAPDTSEVKIPAPSPYGVPLACAIALWKSSAGLTATAGPNSSSWLNGDRGSTPATTAGDTIAPSRSPPVSSLAPSATARRMDPVTRSASVAVISVPMTVSADPGVAGPDRLHLGHQRVEEVRADRRVGDDPLHRNAHLARVDVAAGRDRAGGQVDVRVGQHHDRAGGAKLQGQLLDPGDSRDVLTRGGR